MRVFLPIGGVNSQDLNTLCKVATISGRQILSTERLIGSVTNKVIWICE